MRQVTDEKSGVVFSGPSPTKPWTDVCLAHKTGQRISGPLFFGFSDIVTQRAIAALYTPQELQAALQVRCGSRRPRARVCSSGGRGVQVMGSSCSRGRAGVLGVLSGGQGVHGRADGAQKAGFYHHGIIANLMYQEPVAGWDAKNSRQAYLANCRNGGKLLQHTCYAHSSSDACGCQPSLSVSVFREVYLWQHHSTAVLP